MREGYIAVSELLAAFCLLIFLATIIPSEVSAYPAVNSVNFSPSSSLWIGEDIIIRVNCTDDANHTITGVMAETVGQNGYIIPNKTLKAGVGGLYEVLIESLYMYEPNIFDVDIYCTNNMSEQNIEHSGFTVYSFKAAFLSETSISAYTESRVEFNLNATKNGAAVLHDVSFDVKIDDDGVESIIEPPYDPKKGWIVYIDSPSVPREYDVEILVSHDRTNDTLETTLKVEEGMKFYITKISDSLLESHEKIDVDIRALSGGKVVTLNEENLDIKIGSSNAVIESITPVSDYFRVKIEAPGHIPGGYELVATLKIGDYSYTDTKTVHYSVPISGEIVNYNGDSLSAEIKFLQYDSEILTLNTNSDGKYSGKIRPGQYDVRFTFSESVLELEDVHINEFEDPINYNLFTSADVVTGLKVAGLYVYETTLGFSKVNIEMGYDETDILNEGEIKVYRCGSWNSGKRTCYSEWEEVSASVDTVKNVVEVESVGLSAYAIGNIKDIIVDFGFDKEQYYLKDFIRFSGETRDNDDDKIGNVSLRLRVQGTGLDMRTWSDANGAFSFEFVGPSKEGTYEFLLDAEKYPYIYCNISGDMEVVKSATFSVIFPETIQIKQSEEKSYDIELRNIGQTDLYDINFSLTGVPDGYYTLPPVLKRLGIGETKTYAISFSVPENASRETYSGGLKISSKDLVKEKIFGFSVIGKNETPETLDRVDATQPTGLFGKILGRLALPKITATDSTYLAILLFAAGSFTAALLFRKRRVEKSRRIGIREEVRQNLFNIKSHINLWGDKDLTPKRAQKIDNLHDSSDQTAPKSNPSFTWGQLKEKWLNGDSRSIDSGKAFERDI